MTVQSTGDLNMEDYKMAVVDELYELKEKIENITI